MKMASLIYRIIKMYKFLKLIAIHNNILVNKIGNAIVRVNTIKINNNNVLFYRNNSVGVYYLL